METKEKRRLNPDLNIKTSSKVAYLKLSMFELLLHLVNQCRMNEGSKRGREWR